MGILIFSGGVRGRSLRLAGRGQALGTAQLNQQVIIAGAHDRLPVQGGRAHKLHWQWPKGRSAVSEPSPYCRHQDRRSRSVS